MPTPHLTRTVPLILSAALCFGGWAKQDSDSTNLDKQLLEAASNGEAARVQQLLSKGAKNGAKDQGGDTAIVVAAMQGDRAVVALLLGETIDVNILNDALFWAAMNEPLVISLLSEKIPTSQVGHIRTLDDDFTDVAKLLLDHGAQVEARDAEGNTPLIRAAGHGETGIVKLLLHRGAKVTDRDMGGGTALHAAACECSAIDQPETVDSMRLLLESGADIETRDSDGGTALIYAADWGRTENVQFLLEKHAQLEARDKSGNTSLLVSARGSAYPTAETVEFLLDRGSKIEARNKEGKTALMLAATENGYDRIRIVNLLLKRGADVYSKDYRGNTALSLAEKSDRPDIDGNHPELMKLLKSAMAAPR